MIRFPRPSPERSRVTLTVVPLVAALLLAGVLLFQALDAARSHRATAERALHDYASFAAWQFGRHARTNLQTAIIAVFVLSVTRINPDDPAHGLPSPAEFASIARQRGVWCRCLDGARFFFRYDWRDGSLAIDGAEPSPAVRRWVRDTVAAHTRVFEPPRGILPLPYGSVDGKFRRLSVVLTNDSYVTVFRELEGRLRVIAYVLSRDTRGNPVVSYGFESDAVPFVTPLFRQILEQEPVLPPSLLGAVPSDSVMAVSVTDLAGHPLLTTPAKFAARYTAADTLENRFGRLVVNVALRPEIANALIVGGLPRSRVPVLLATFLLTVGLLAASLVQLRRQQELVRLRSDFVSSVSHELRTPLAQIRLFAELLHRGTLRTDDERRRSARVVHQEARRLTYLVENVLTFARNERRAGRLFPEPTDVGAEIGDALEAFAPLAEARAVRVARALDPDVRILVDRASLRQVLLNLLDNAVKYGPWGQTVTVGARRAGAVARLWVDDQGPGIPPEDRERVWEPYFRLERDRAAAVGGSGIGLALVRDLVMLQGGAVRLADAPGGGTRVEVEFPLVDAAPAAPAADAPRGERDAALTTTAEAART